jgi:hypothetical protein
MSFDTKAAIVALLVGDPGPLNSDTGEPDATKSLSALLAADPDAPANAPRPAILNTRMSVLLAGKIVYPCVTFRENVGGTVPAFRPTPVEINTPADRQNHERFDFEIWAQTPDGGATIQAIKSRMDAILNPAKFVTTGGATVSYCVEVADIPDCYDDKLIANFRAVGYELQVLYPAS